MSGLLQAKVVLVTGAAQGIGRAIALGCAREGADVAVNDFAPSAQSYSLIAEIQALGRSAHAVFGDVGDPATARAFIAEAAARLGRVDVLISNAGICPFHSFLDLPPDVLERTTRTNLFGAFYMTQAAANHMKAAGRGGAIIAISSISALVGGAMQTHYTPTKAGVHSLMQSCAIALGPYRIRCNSILPGTIETAINAEDLRDQAKRAAMVGRIPLGRLGEPEDCVGPAVFLASDMARYVTGGALLVDGGAYVNLQ